MNRKMSLSYNILRINDNELIFNGITIIKGKDNIYRCANPNEQLDSEQWSYLLKYIKAEIRLADEQAQREVDNLLKEMGIQKFCKN